MTQIPRSALLLGLAGVLPFVWGALTLLSPALGDWALDTLGGRFTGPYVQLYYGVVILAFMSGVLWGFATKATGEQATTGYVLSVIPALWAFFMTGIGTKASGVSLIVGFLGLLMIDAAFARWGLAPAWWMKLRVLLTTLVVACLAVSVVL